MQIIKLTILTLFIALPVFMLSALDAQAATHECADTVGVCNYVYSSGVKTYNATPVFDKVDQRYEWNCGFGNGQVSCPEEPATSVSPTPTPPPSSGGNTPPTTSKGNQTQTTEGTYLGEEETITKIVDRCPCPTCGDKHYDCIKGKDSVLGVYAKNKKEETQHYTGSDGVKRYKTVWTWRCIDSCGNLTGECREESEAKFVSARCVPNACVNSNDCTTCAKCEIGTPVITTSVANVPGQGAVSRCEWYCESKNPDGTKSRDYCSSQLAARGYCGNAQGVVSNLEPSHHTHADWSGLVYHSIRLRSSYVDELGQKNTREYYLCDEGYYPCSVSYTAPITGPREYPYVIKWKCCTKNCDDSSKSCRDCWGTMIKDAPETNYDGNFRKTIENPGSATTTDGTSGTTGISNTTATVGVGVFRPSSWY